MGIQNKQESAQGCKRINDVHDAYEVDTPMHFLFDLEMLICDKITYGLTPEFFSSYVN